MVNGAASALDATSRILVFEAIKLWRQNKTTVGITHHLSQTTPEDFEEQGKGELRKTMETRQSVCDSVAARVWGTRGVTRAEVEDACRAALVKICMYVVSSIPVIAREKEQIELPLSFLVHEPCSIP